MNIGSVEINVSLIIGGESHASVQIGFIERVIKFDKDDVPCLGPSLPYFASCFPSSNVLSGHSWLGWWLCPLFWQIFLTGNIENICLLTIFVFSLLQIFVLASNWFPIKLSCPPSTSSPLSSPAFTMNYIVLQFIAWKFVCFYSYYVLSWHCHMCCILMTIIIVSPSPPRGASCGAAHSQTSPSGSALSAIWEFFFQETLFSLIFSDF